MHTDPSTTSHSSTGPALDIADFTDMIAFANASAAFEFLMTVKSGVQFTATALTECATPEVRNFVREELMAGLRMHERISDLMVQKGWLHPYQPDEQLRLDLVTAQRTSNLAKLPLFKDRSKVLEAFDTAQKPARGSELQ